MTNVNARDWTNIFFFSQSPPNFIKVNYETQVDFKPFHPDQKWLKWFLWKPVATGRPSGQDRVQVLWLVAKDDGGMIHKYVAKVVSSPSQNFLHLKLISGEFPEYTEHDAQLQLRRVPAPRDLREVMKELDPFENEARVFQRIEKCCDNPQIYFPRFYGVITDLDRSRFRYGYPNRRAIILEAIKPELASRRILAAHDDNETRHIECLRSRLQSLDLSDFEREFYCSLLTDRCRRLSTLHSLAITHGDVKDEHFRLPGDFHDTVLYDFSVSYTFSPEPPYLVNFRSPRSLKVISDYELGCVEEQIYNR
ncbi:hypothetical protein Aspvir_004060 [Aspergillus viridinutans]|uniref:Protein kinase domain-containing protein n=1 Tax=Aspergillus viridinutans TaxID=75553 RepID=A0A9P3BUB0_ASPVI|nr:uncharacterized protein Aspvir_004060 [Aspergillus viridinutans]GIK00046.1 hypothetical protein Aspvir_004060 [Aspergillus viridinutans]